MIINLSNLLVTNGYDILSVKLSPVVAVLPCGHLFYLTNVIEVLKIWDLEKLKRT